MAIPENARGSAGTGTPSSSGTSCHRIFCASSHSARYAGPSVRLKRKIATGRVATERPWGLRGRLRARIGALRRKPRVDGRHDSSRIEPAFREELRGIAVVDENVGQAKLQ